MQSTFLPCLLWPATRLASLRRPGAESDRGRNPASPTPNRWRRFGNGFQPSAAGLITCCCWSGSGASAFLQSAQRCCSMPWQALRLGSLFGLSGGQLAAGGTGRGQWLSAGSVPPDPCAAAARPAPRPPALLRLVVMGSVAVHAKMLALAHEASGQHAGWLGCFPRPQTLVVGVQLMGCCASSAKSGTPAGSLGTCSASAWRGLALARRSRPCGPSVPLTGPSFGKRFGNKICHADPGYSIFWRHITPETWLNFCLLNQAVLRPVLASPCGSTTTPMTTTPEVVLMQPSLVRSDPLPNTHTLSA